MKLNRVEILLIFVFVNICLGLPFETANFMKGCSDLRAFSVSEKTDIVITGDTLGYMHFHNLTSGDFLRTIKAHDNKITHIEISANGTLALSTSSDSTIKVWDTQTGDIIHIFQESKYIKKASFCGNDSLVYMPYSGLIKGIFDTTHVDSTLVPADSAFQFSADGTLFLNEEDVYDVKTGTKLSSSKKWLSDVTAATISQDKKVCAIGNSSSKVVIFDTETGDSLDYLNYTRGYVRGLYFSSDNSKLFIGYSSGTVCVWDYVNNKYKYSYEVGVLKTLIPSENRAFFYSFCNNTTVYKWHNTSELDVDTIKSVVSLHPALPLGFSHDGKQAIYQYGDAICFANSVSGLIENKIPLDEEKLKISGVNAVYTIPNSHNALIINSREFAIYDTLNDTTLLHTPPFKSGLWIAADNPVISSDNSQMVITYNAIQGVDYISTRIFVMDLVKADTTLMLFVGTRSKPKLSFSSDGSQITASFGNTAISAWNISDGEKLFNSSFPSEVIIGTPIFTQNDKKIVCRISDSLALLDSFTGEVEKKVVATTPGSKKDTKLIMAPNGKLYFLEPDEQLKVYSKELQLLDSTRHYSGDTLFDFNFDFSLIGIFDEKGVALLNSGSLEEEYQFEINEFHKDKKFILSPNTNHLMIWNKYFIGVWPFKSVVPIINTLDERCSLNKKSRFSYNSSTRELIFTETISLNSIVELSLYTLQGKEVFRKSFKYEGNSINIASELAKGPYLLMLKQEGKMICTDLLQL